MTVRELRKKLETLGEDLEIQLTDGGANWDLDNIEVVNFQGEEGEVFVVELS